VSNRAHRPSNSSIAPVPSLAGRVRRLASGIYRRELLILALCTPALLFIRPALTPLLLPLLWLCRRLAAGHFVPPGRLNAPLLLLGALLINIFATPDIRQSLPKISELLCWSDLSPAGWSTTDRCNASSETENKGSPMGMSIVLRLLF
jgi:hypothetical protein